MIGYPGPRLDARAKATGKAVYVDDLRIANLLHACPVLARVPHARLRALHTERARGMPGVRAVVTAADVPGKNEIGVVQAGHPLLVADRVRYVGEVLAVCVADEPAQARAAAAAVTADLEELPGVFGIEEALAEGAPTVHDAGNVAVSFRVRKGDVDAALQRADVVVERTFRTGAQEHAYLETLGAVVQPVDGGVVVYGSLQCPYYVQKGVAGVLGTPYSAVRVVQLTTGGGFGGKEDVPSEICAMAALGAHVTGRPVKLVLGREEDILRTSKRHPMVIRYRLGAARDGRFVAAEVDIKGDCGAYPTISPVVLWRSTVHGPGPYVIPNVKVDCVGAFTNLPPSGAFRGFGAPQVALAHEGIVDDLARALGRDPIDLRLQNALYVGAELPTGAPLEESAPLKETLTGARDRCRWDERRSAPRAAAGPRRRGLGVACMHYGVSLGAKGWHLDASGALVQVHQDGSVAVAIGGTEIGQGAKTAMALIAAEALGCPVDRVRVVDTDTALVADSGPTVASRTTVMSGNAVLDACGKLAARLEPVRAELAAAGQPAAFHDVTRVAYGRNLDLAATGWYVAPQTTFDNETGQGDAYFVYAFATHVAEVEVDTRTGEVRVLRMTCAHDIGRAINRDGVEGQVQGGVLQGVGYARYEDFRTAQGKVLSSTLTTYIVPTAADVPEVDLVLIEEPWSKGPYGAKGIGEPAIIPAAAAIANAVADALGFPVSEIPLTPERVWRLLRERGAG